MTEVERPEFPELGKWLTNCGPGESQSMFTKICQWGSLVMGVGSFFVPIVQTPAPGEEAGVWTLFGMLGGLMIVVFLILFVLSNFFYSKTIVHLYENGLAFREDEKSRFESIPWDQISGVRLVTIWEDRFSNHIQVHIDRGKGGEVQFTSQLLGDSEAIIVALRKRISNIEESTITL